MIARLKTGCLLLVLGFAAALVLALVLSRPTEAPVYLLPTPTPDDPTAGVRTVAGGAFWGSLAVLCGCLALAGVAGLLMWADRHWQQRPQLGLVAFADGVPPIYADALRGPVADDLRRLAVAGYWDAEIAEAANPGSPEHLALSYQVREVPRGALAAPIVDRGSPVVNPLPALTYETVAREIAARGAYYMGQQVQDGAALWTPAGQGRSVLSAAHGGGGKTTLMVQAACQDLLLPPAARGVPGLAEAAYFIVIDPAAGKPGSFTERFARPLQSRVLFHARTAAETVQACRWFNQEGRSRLDAGIADGHRWPLVLVVDDASLIYDEEDFIDAGADTAITSAFKRANTQFRAVGCCAIAGVQLLQAYAFGGGKAATKRSFYVRAFGQLDAEDVALTGLPPALARQLPLLQPGHFLITGGMPPVEVLPLHLSPGEVAGTLDLARAATVNRVLFGSAGSPGPAPVFPVITPGDPSADEAAAAPGAAPGAAPEEAPSRAPGVITGDLMVEWPAGSGKYLDGELVDKVRKLYRLGKRPGEIVPLVSAKGTRGGPLASQVGAIHHALVQADRAALAQQQGGKS